MARGKIRLALLIHRLDPGGAERQLMALAQGLDKEKFQVLVITLYPGGALSDELKGLKGVRLESLKRKRRWEFPIAMARLMSSLRRSGAHAVYGFMEVPAQMSLLVGRVLGLKVIWGLRRSARDFGDYERAEKVSFQTGRYLSSWADLIILNSFKGKEDYAHAGYCARRMEVVPNGIDTDHFVRYVQKGLELKRSWGLGPDNRAIGVVARLHPMKGHEIFLRAAQRVAARHPDVFFVCAGRGEPKRLLYLQGLACGLGLGEKVIWAGEVQDVVSLYSALDLLCLPSIYGEGFPNVVGEAMSCQVPCVVSNVGDSARVVGDTGLVVPKGDSEKLASALDDLLAESGEGLAHRGKLARERVLCEFGIEKMVVSTTRLIESLMWGQPASFTISG